MAGGGSISASRNAHNKGAEKGKDKKKLVYAADDAGGAGFLYEDEVVAAPSEAAALRKSAGAVAQEKKEGKLEKVIRKGPVVRALERHIDRRHLAMRLPPLLFLMCVFVAVVLLNRDVLDAYSFEKTVSSTLLEKERENSKAFPEIETTADFYSWIEGPFLDFLFEDKWYNGDTAEGVASQSYLRVNKVLGGVILKQRRVREGTCEKSPRFEEFMPMCWGRLTDSNEITEEPFGEGRWTWKEIHGEEGYIETLPLEREAALELLEDLRTHQFVDFATREIDVDFSLLNANLGQTLVARIKFKFTQTGFIRKEAVLHTIRLEPYSTDLDDARLALEIIFAILIVAQIVYEAWEVFLWGVRRRNLTGYIASGWPVVRWLNICFNISILSVWYAYVNNDQRKNTELPFPEGEVQDFEKIAEDVELFLTLSGVNVLIFVVCLFETLRFNERFAFITSTFSRAWPRLWSFTLVFFFVFVGFATIGHVLFGHSLLAFSTIPSSINASFTIITGETQYEVLNEVDSISAVFFYYSFLLLIFFLLSNIFIAVLIDGYLEVVEEKRFKNYEVNSYGLKDYAKEFATFAFRGGHLFRSARALDFLREPGFRLTDRITESDARALARRRGYDQRLISQLIGRYGISDVEGAGHLRASKEATSVHAAVVAEFDRLSTGETTVLGADDVNELKKRCLAHIDAFEGDDGIDDESDGDLFNRYRGTSAIDWDASSDEGDDGTYSTASGGAYTYSASGSTDYSYSYEDDYDATTTMGSSESSYV